MSTFYNKTNKVTEVLERVQRGILRKTLGTTCNLGSLMELLGKAFPTTKPLHILSHQQLKSCSDRFIFSTGSQ